MFVDGVERLEVKELGSGESTACNTRSTNNGSVDVMVRSLCLSVV